MMQLTSPEFNHGEQIPQEFTCLGANINPTLFIAEIPENAKSLVLIFEDIDATPKPWTHWLVFNIPATTVKINKNEIPEGGTEALANNHSFGYEGPCPKYFKDTHQYWFRLYALDIELNLPAATEREVIEQKMHKHIIEVAELLTICTSPEGAYIL